MQAANKNLEAGAKWIAALTSHGSKGLSPRSKAMLQHGADHYRIYAQTGNEQYRELCGSYIHSALRVDGAAKIYVAEKKTSAIQIVLIAVAMLALALLTACGATNPTYEVLGVRVYNNTAMPIPKAAMARALTHWARSYADWAGISHSESMEYLVHLRSISISPFEHWDKGNEPYGLYDIRGKVWTHWRGCIDLSIIYHELMHHWRYNHASELDHKHTNDAAWEQVSVAYRAHKDRFCAVVKEEADDNQE